MVKTRGKAVAPGLRALQASGDGHWEMDLVDGSTWFSEWFYRTLAWDLASGQKSLSTLRAHLHEQDFLSLLRDIRLHLEEHVPLDCEVRMRLPDGAPRCWQIRGAAQYDTAGKPVFLAGIVRDVTGERAHYDATLQELASIRHHFDGLRELLHGKRSEFALEYADAGGAAKHRLHLLALPGESAGRRNILVSQEDPARAGAADQTVIKVN